MALRVLCLLSPPNHLEHSRLVCPAAQSSLRLYGMLAGERLEPENDTRNH